MDDDQYNEFGLEISEEDDVQEINDEDEQESWGRWGWLDWVCGGWTSGSRHWWERFVKQTNTYYKTG